MSIPRLLAVLAPVTIYSWSLAVPLTILCAGLAWLAAGTKGQDEVKGLLDMGLSYNGCTPKWKVCTGKLENPIKMDDVGVPPL